MPRSNKSTGCVISLVLTSLLLVSGLVVFVALAQLGQPNQWLFNLTGEEALLIAEREPIDLVLLDLMLPGMSGMEVLKQLRGRDPDDLKKFLKELGKDLLEF